MSSTSSEPPPAHSSPLTQHQIALMSRYVLHKGHVADIENDIVDIQIDIARERDQPSVEHHEKDLAKAQADLQWHRDEKMRKEKELKQEEERLKTVVGEEAALAKKQLKEIGFYLGRERTMTCLR